MKPVARGGPGDLVEKSTGIVEHHRLYRGAPRLYLMRVKAAFAPQLRANLALKFAPETRRALAAPETSQRAKVALENRACKSQNERPRIVPTLIDASPRSSFRKI
jgi:hypothetical protein